MAWSTTGLVFGLWAAVAVVAVLAAGGNAGKKTVLPIVRGRLALAMQHALAGADAAAVGGVDDLIAEHAPADQIPPGLREAIDIVWDGVNRRYDGCRARALHDGPHRKRLTWLLAMTRPQLHPVHADDVRRGCGVACPAQHPLGRHLAAHLGPPQCMNRPGCGCIRD